MGKCPDFIREETLLQCHGKAMGMIVDHSPIAHPEVAGEGVEYDWGFSKLFYRRHPLAVKRSKEKFRDLVRKCISRETITTEMRRKFARRARRYTLAYLSMHLAKKNGADGLKCEMSASLIEKIVKMFKMHRTHRNVLNQEQAFLKVDGMKKIGWDM